MCGHTTAYSILGLTLCHATWFMCSEFKTILKDLKQNPLFILLSQQVDKATEIFAGK